VLHRTDDLPDRIAEEIDGSFEETGDVVEDFPQTKTQTKTEL
jgi:hypothetical protein